MNTGNKWLDLVWFIVLTVQIAQIVRGRELIKEMKKELAEIQEMQEKASENLRHMKAYRDTQRMFNQVVRNINNGDEP